MKVVKHAFAENEPADFYEFADKHGLEFHIHEREAALNESGRLPSGRPFKRYWGGLDHIEVKDGRMLSSASGNGDSLEEVLKDYAAQLAGRHLVYRAMQPGQRREFCAPNDLHIPAPKRQKARK